VSVVIHSGVNGVDAGLTPDAEKPKKLKSKPVDRCPKCRGKLIFGVGWPPSSDEKHKHSYRACERCPYFVEVFVK